MNTQEAFHQVIHQRGVYHELELNSEQARQYRHQLKYNKVSDNAIHSVLEHYRTPLIQEEV